MRAAAFARKGIVTLEDALYYFPRRYEDRQRLCSPRDLLHLPEGLKVTVLARMQQTRELPLRGRKQSLLELTSMGEEGDLLSCTWFHVYKGLKEKLAPGTWAIFHGDLKKYRGAPQLVHPEIEFLKGKPGSGTSSIPKSLHWGRVVPI